MKSLYILGIIALLGLAMYLQVDNKTNSKYLQWKAEFGMSFSDEEDQYREQIFAENLKIIENHNDPSYSVGINQFSGLTKAEFKAIYLRTFEGARTGKPHKMADVQVSDIDWRTKGVVSPVKNQGQCGSCWAFSVTGNMESVNMMFGSKTMLLFSEQQLVDCSSSYGNQGCNGGVQDYAFKYVEQKGIESESQYPYTGVQGTCKSTTGSFKIKSYHDVTRNDCNSLLNALMIEPISITVDAANWSNYKSGILKICGTSLDHAVLLVGYNQEGGYYIVKNSWGTTWGEQGYIQLALGNTCGICAQCQYSSL